MVNFEMIGVPMERDYLVYLTGYKKSNMAERFNAYAGKPVIGYLPKASHYDLFQRSDNYPFHKKFKVPSQTICSFDFHNYPYYHHVEDENDKMNFKHMAKVVNAVIPMLTTMSNTATQEIRYNK